MKYVLLILALVAALSIGGCCNTGCSPCGPCAPAPACY